MRLAVVCSKGADNNSEGVSVPVCFGESEMMHWCKGLPYLQLYTDANHRNNLDVSKCMQIVNLKKKKDPLTRSANFQSLNLEEKKNQKQSNEVKMV